MNPVITLKTVLLGKISSGKTSICSRFVDKTYDKTTATISAAFHQSTMTIGTAKIQFQVWDLPGGDVAHGFRNVTPVYYRGASICLCCADCTNQDSFTYLPDWIKDVQKRCVDIHPDLDSMIIAIVITKVDLEPTWDLELAENYAKENNFLFFKTSAKADVGISEMFYKLGKLCYENKGKGIPSTKLKDTIVLQDCAKNESNCCGK